MLQELVYVALDGPTGRYAVRHMSSCEPICYVDAQEDAEEVADVCAAKLALERGIPLESLAFRHPGALADILPGLEDLRAMSWTHLVETLTGGEGGSQDAALQATQPMEEDAEEPLSTAISSSQPHDGEEAAQPAPPAAIPAKQAAAPAAAEPPQQAADTNTHTSLAAHCTPAAAAAAQAVGAAAAAAAAAVHDTPLGSKRSVQAAGLSPRSGSKQQRVDLLLGLATGKLPLPAPAEQQPQQGLGQPPAGQQRRCRVCSSASPGPYTSACWHRHPETKEEWLCQSCHGKAVRQFKKKQAQQGQNQGQQLAEAAAAAAEAATEAAAAPLQLQQQPQQAAAPQRETQLGVSAGALTAAVAAGLPGPPQQPVAQPAIVTAAQPSLDIRSAAGTPLPQPSHSGTQTGPPAPAAGAAAEAAPAAGAAGAIAAAQVAAGEAAPSQYELYCRTKQALAACGAPVELRHAYLQQVFMRLPYEVQRMHHDEVADMQGEGEQAWGMLRQFIANEVERQRSGGSGPLGASPGDTSGGSVPGH